MRKPRQTAAGEPDKELAAADAPPSRLEGMSATRKTLFALLPAFLLFGGLELGLWIDGFEYDGSSRLGVAMAGESTFWRPSTAPDYDTLYRFKPVQNRAPLGEHPPYPKGARNFDINEHGYRGPFFPEEKPDEETIRVLAYGDSVTFGMFLPLEETYPWLLTKDLQADGLNAEVLNMGLSSYTSAQNLWDFEARGDTFHPDVLLLQVGVWNDFSVPSNRFTDREVRVHLRSKELLSQNSVLRHVKTAQLLFKLVDSLRKDLADDRPKPAKNSKMGHRYAEEGQVRRVPIDHFRQNVSRILKMASARGLPVLVVVPTLAKRTRSSLGHVVAEYHQVLREIERSDRVRVVDLEPIVDANGGDALFLDNCHYNAAGCRVVADALRGPLEELVRLKIAERPPETADVSP